MASKNPGLTLTTERDVIAALGGIQAVAELTGESYGAVCNWLSRGFPARFYAIMTDALAAKGIAAKRVLWGQVEPV